MSPASRDYFRLEARELVDRLLDLAGSLAPGAAPPAAVSEARRLAHTLKGAAGVVKQARVAELAHALEDALGDDPGGFPAVPALLAALDEELLAREAEAPGDDPRAAAPGEREPGVAGSEAVPVPVSELDALLEGLVAVTVQAEALRREVARLAGPTHHRAAALPAGEHEPGPEGRGDGLPGRVRRLERELRAVRERAQSVRLLPASLLLGELERAALTAARAQGLEVVFQGRGGEQRIDARALFLLRTSLRHVVANAVAHGIEPPAERAAAGKPRAGRVAVRVERRGPRLAVVCEDDGRGMDLEALRRAAVASGAVEAAAAGGLGPDEVVELAFQPGVTTSGSATLSAGRGVGLDAVRQVARQLRGEVRARSGPAGTAIEVEVPESVAVVESLLLQAGGRRVSLPLEAVERVLRIRPEEMAAGGAEQAVVSGGEAVPFIPLARLLGEPGRSRREPWTVLLVRAGPAERVAIGVDRLVRAREEVVRPLPRSAGDLPLLAGASFDADGAPHLMLDPAGLARLARAAGREPAPPAPARRLPVLVVDDSLTTRMLEQSILEAHGYEVELASSGEEALRRLRERRFGAMLLDVEMPGLSGFEVLERLRADRDLAELPVIMVTTRGAEEDRRRGLEGGARGYLLKSEFDEQQLLTTIRSLVG